MLAKIIDAIVTFSCNKNLQKFPRAKISRLSIANECVFSHEANKLQGTFIHNKYKKCLLRVEEGVF